MEGDVFVTFRDTTPLGPDGQLEAILHVCKERGLSTERDVDCPPVPDNVALNDENQLKLYLGQRRMRFRFRGPEYWEGPAGSVLTIIADVELVQPSDDSPENDYTGDTWTFVELIRDIALELDPVLVATWNTIHRGEIFPLSKKVLPLDTPIESDLERIPWLGIYSAPFIEEFGGRERVLETPAWKVEELDNGSILIITTKEPWAEYRSKHPADRYLLEGQDAPTREEADSGLSDPFAQLEPGTYGADVCVHRDDIAAEFRNEDMQLVRVRVDEDRNLRRIDDDTFVRNIVVDSLEDKVAFVKQMLADIPPDARQDELMVSALLHEAIPPSFVRLADPDGENVVTRVMNLDVDTNKYELLVSLGRAAQQDEFGAEDLRTMEQGLTNLADLENVEGIEQWIEDAFL